MDNKIIPFPLQPQRQPGNDIPYWAERAYEMLYTAITRSQGKSRPEKVFACYEEGGKIYYLNLGYTRGALAGAIMSIEDYEDSIKDQAESSRP